MVEALKHVEIYADGACSGNPGPGGWGAILICQKPPARKELSGADPATTNNRMELMAVISALESLLEPCSVLAVTDSQYVCDAFLKKWVVSWQKKNWRKADGQPVKNIELWQRLLAAMKPHKVNWKWVRGHAGHPENERADELAVDARESLVRKGR